MICDGITKRVFIEITDFLILSFSLYLALTLRNLEFLPHQEYLSIFKSFLLVLILNLLVFYAHELYDKITVKIYQKQKDVSKFSITTDAVKDKPPYYFYHLKNRSSSMNISLILMNTRNLFGKSGYNFYYEK